MKIKELKKEIMCSNDEDFIKFIKKNFEEIRETNTVAYQNNLDVLKKMDNDALATGIARTEIFENHFSSIKGLSFIFSLIATLVSYYKDFLSYILGGNQSSIFVPLIITVTIFVFTCRLYVKARNEMLTCVFFKRLLLHAKEA